MTNGKLIAILVAAASLIVLTLAVSHGQEPPEAVVYEFDLATCELVEFVSTPNGATVNRPITHGEDLDRADALVCKTQYPLMTDRLSSFGTIRSTTGRDGFVKRSIDKSDEDKLTAAGRELHRDLMALMVGRLFGVFQAPLSYNSVTIVPYDQIPNDALIEPIKAAFAKAAKLDAATE